MKTPEMCPWCGAPENIRADGVRTGTYVCEASLLGRGLWGNMAKSHAMCRFGTLPFAAAYRETLAWRKRLSQHTGVPLRLVPEPEPMAIGCAGAWWGEIGLGSAKGFRGLVLSLYHGIHGGLPLFEFLVGEFGRNEARRRLLAMGGEK